jgi:outer membrane protein OmpA-like peptidoglycan-associated protein/tetratricopeptide (TPR) repeat protein
MLRRIKHKKMKKLIIPIIALLAIATNCVSQEKSRSELKGDKYAFKYSYNKAIESYTDAKELTPEGQRKLAESYCKMEQDDKAEATYAKLIKSSKGVIAEDYYNYAMILKSMGKYDEANKSMDNFSDQKPADLRAKDYEAHKSELPSLLKDDGKYKLLHLDANTNAQDFGTSYYKDKIVFASTRSKNKMFRKKYNLNGKPFLNMYVSDVDGEQLKKPEIFEKDLDSKMHDGPASFNKDGSFMAFTRNHSNDKSKDLIVELQILFSTYKDGDWSKPEAFAYNNDAYSVGHPALSADGNTMYFVSDMPGGFGGTDIYKTTKAEKGEWTKPENLGDKINTEGDELFPFFEENTGTLLFSSNGRFGLGEQDIFISTVSGSGFSNVHNAGAPLNTQYDDFAGIVNGKTNKGYFSSNRVGGSGDDDLYSVEFLKGLEERKRIEGIAKDKNGTAIPKTFITLYDDKGNTIDTVTTKDDAAYSFFADSDKNFKLIGKKEKYTDGENTASTFGKEAAVTADVILLTKQEVIAKKIETDTDLGKIVELKPIYFDLDKFNLRPDAVTELDKIVKIMNEYPKMIVELGSYTDCRETKEYNQILSDKRAKTSAWYIKKRISNPDRVSGKGYGETKLVNGCSCDGNVVSDCSEEEHQKNRRSEFTIIKPAAAKK